MRNRKRAGPILGSKIPLVREKNGKGKNLEHDGETPVRANISFGV